MADRTSAALFAELFELFAEDPIQHRNIAHRVHDFSGNYDFNTHQMDCDEALIVLGLARDGDDGVEYLGEDY